MSETTNSPTRRAPLSFLRSALNGTLALPGEPGYELCASFNLAVHNRPAAVVAVADAADIAAVMRFADAHRLRVAVQSTGHGGVQHDPSVLVVHTGQMKCITVDRRRKVARIDAGVRASDLLDAAASDGLAPLLGTSGTVGVAGYLSGGGVGPLVSTFGLSSDYVRSLDVVTGDGQQLRASPTENPDLYWAFRGGRASVGGGDVNRAEPARSGHGLRWGTVFLGVRRHRHGACLGGVVCRTARCGHDITGADAIPSRTVRPRRDGWQVLRCRQLRQSGA